MNPQTKTALLIGLSLANCLAAVWFVHTEVWRAAVALLVLELPLMLWIGKSLGAQKRA